MLQLHDEYDIISLYATNGCFACPFIATLSHGKLEAVAKYVHEIIAPKAQ